MPAPPLPPLASLEAVRAVARHGTLTAAALALGVTHGALSRRVAAVEGWLGVALFERHGRGMRPTPDGQRFSSRVEEAFALIELAADPWRRRRGPDIVRLSVLPAFARHWLFKRLQDLEQGSGEASPLRVDLEVSHRTADVEAGEADVAVRYGRGSWRGVASTPMMAERLVPVARADVAHSIARAGSRVAAILEHPLLHDSDATGWRAWLGEERPSFRPRPHDRRFEDYDLVIAAALGGLGVALARVPFAEEAARAAGLVPVSAHTVANPLAHHIVTRLRDVRPSVAALVARLKAAAP